jgi:hypothetical protein
LAVTGDLTTTVDLSGGTLELQTGGVVDGRIVFVDNGTLQIDGSAMPANVISGFAPGDTIDLSNVNYDVNGCIALSVVQTNVLTIYENGNSYNLTLDPSQSFADEQFELAPDAGGQGTDITVEQVTPRTVAPAITAPASATLGVGKAHAISGISLSEAGNTAASGETFTVTLADTYGDLSASGGGTITGSGTTNLTITGSLSQLNSDLATLTDQDSTAGSDTITLNAVDSFGNTAAPPTIAVTVNGLPVIAAPTSGAVGVNQPSPITGVSLSESGNTAASGETFKVTLTDTYGDLSARGSGVSGSGTNLTIVGSLSQVNSDLATLTDQDGTAASDTIALAASDSFGNAAAPQTIAVTVNGTPAIVAPPSTTLGVGKTDAISGVSLSESGNTTGETFTVTVTDTYGDLSATGSGASGSGTSLTITGSLSQVNSDLATLTDQDGTAGSDTITLNASDSFGNTAAPQAILVTVNGTPAIAPPPSTTVGVSKTHAISGVSLSETGNTASSGETFTVTLADTYGDLSATGSGVSGQGTTSLTITGSLSQLNGDLATLTDRDGTAGSDTITLNAVDSFGNTAAQQTIAVTVNGLPVIAVSPTATVGVNRASPISGVSLSETGNTTGETFTVTVANTFGGLTAAGSGVFGSGTTNLTIVGSLSQVNSDLATLTDQNSTAGSDTITFNASDSFGNSAAPQTIAVAVNGLPLITAPPSTTVGVNQVNPIRSVSLSETGNTVSSGETFTVTLTDTYGDLSASGSGVSGQGTTSLTITGSLSQVSSDLATLTDQDGTIGSDAITLNAVDSFGNTAAEQTIAVTVNGLPVITAPASTTVGVGKAHAISGVSLSESGNTTGETFTVTVADRYGDLSVTGSGVSGSGTTSLTIVGSLSQVNSDLATLTDRDGSSGSDTISLNAIDSFGNIAAPQTIVVTANGLPVITAPPSTTVGVSQASPISGVSLSETGNTTSSGETFTVTLADTYGDLSATGSGVSGHGTTSLTIMGSLSQVNSDLATLTDQDGTAGSDTITLNAVDSFGNTAAQQTIAVTALLPTVSWAAGVSGNWTTAADWSPAGVPSSADNAAINVGGVYTVTSAASATVGSLNIGYAAVTLNITGGTFTIDDGTANGSNAGTIKVEGGAALPTLDLLGVLTNTASALVSAAASGAIIDLLGGGLSGGAVNIVSGAALEATGGGASPSTITGATVTDKGILQASGGTVLTLANATVDGTGGAIEASGTGSAVVLDNAILNGGTLTTANGGAIESIAGQDGTLDGVTISSGSTITVANASTLNLQGTIVDDGTIAVDSTGGATDLVAAASGATLSGGGSVTLADSASGAIVGEGPGAVLTNSGDTIAGAGSIGSGDGNLTLVNKGTIDATGTTNSLVLDTGSIVLANTETIEATGAAGLEILNTTVSNTGTIAAETGVALLDDSTIVNTGGTILAAAGENVELSGSMVNGGKLTTQPGGAIVATGADLSTVNGATVTNDGTLEAAAGAALLLATATVTSDASGVIEATGAGSLVELDNATVTGGTLTTANGGAIETVAGSNSTLSGVTVGSGSTATAVDGSTLTLKGTVTDGGTIALSSNGDATDLAISGSVTLGGSGTVTLAGNAAIVAAATGAKLTNSATIAGAGQIGNLGDGNLTLTNKGTIDASGSNAIVIDTGKTLTNSGTLEATGSGGLTVDDAVANSGTLVANGGNVTIGGNLTGAGQAEIFGNSTLELGGTASNGVTFASSGAGSLILDLAQGFTGTVAGLASGNSIDLKNFLSGDTTITKVTGTGVIGTDTNVTLTDPNNNLTLTLHLLNQYAGQFGISASDYALTPDHMPGNGTLFQLAPSHV